MDYRVFVQVSRDRLVLLVLAVLLLGGGLVLLQGPGLTPPPPPGPTADPADGAGADDGQVDPAAPAGVDGEVVAPSPAVAAAREVRPDTTGWTNGIIRGDISMAVNTIDRIESLLVVVEEQRLRNGPDGTERTVHSQMVPVAFDRRSTPTFEVRNVPFSSYPYLVTLYSPGLNGSRRTVTIDQQHPLADDVVLQLTAPGPFTLLVRDQDGLPHHDLDVRLLPVGEPQGRPRHDASTDSYGSAIFPSVLGGEYQVLLMQGGQVLLQPPPTIAVQAEARLYQTQIQGQGHTVTLPRGMPLEVRAVDVRGYGVPDARVKVYATERLKLTERVLTTDVSGRARFEHLAPGIWQIDVQKDGYQPRAQRITIQDRQPHDPVEIKLIWLR